MIPTAVLRHRVTIQAYVGDSAYGPTWDIPMDRVPARVVGRRRAVRTSTGVDVIADATATIRPGRDIPAESLLTHRGRTYTVVGVADAEDLTGPAGVELILAGPRPAEGV